MYIPTDAIRFRIIENNGRLYAEPAEAQYDRGEIRQAMRALGSGLLQMQFTTETPIPPATRTEHPLLPLRFPVLRRWTENNGGLELTEQPLGGPDEELVLSPEGSRTWRLRWLRDSQSFDVVGDDTSAEFNELWGADTLPALELTSSAVAQGADGRLLISGRWEPRNAPRLTHPFELEISWTGGRTTANVATDGHFAAAFEAPPHRPASMQFELHPSLLIGTARAALDTREILIRTAFADGVVLVDGEGAKFGATMPAGRLPKEIRFGSSAYRPQMTEISFRARNAEASYGFRMQAIDDDRYSLECLEHNDAARMQLLLDDDLDVVPQSQDRSAATLAVVPESLPGRWWRNSEGALQWHPSKELRDITPPSGETASRGPRSVSYRGMTLRVDATAFDALLLEHPQRLLTSQYLSLTSTTGNRPRGKKTFSCRGVEGEAVGSLQFLSKGKYEPKWDVPRRMKALKPVLIQDENGSEQGLLWATEALPAGFETCQRVALDALEDVADHAAILYFRGIYQRVNIRRIAGAIAGEHTVIELATPLPFHASPLLEPFFPVMASVDDARPLVFLWYAGSPATSLPIRSDGLMAGERTGYVYRPFDGRALTQDQRWATFPPSTRTAEIVYHSWNGFLLRLDASTRRIVFAGWFLENGSGVYPARPPFSSYGFSARRAPATGLLEAGAISGAAAFAWTEATIDEEDKSIILKEVRNRYLIPSSEGDLRKLDPREQTIPVGDRLFALQPSCKANSIELQILVQEVPSAGADKLDGGGAVQLYVARTTSG